jgi:UDP-N-acetylglucosamine 2-epimerase (non-hydrolysing)/GDP/UDP-N,N'-diacetylbacillosamine 2-epimerase (hydrolysing)
MRKIAVITGTRADYGYLKPLMKALQRDKELQLIPIVTGMHLMPDFGDSYKIVEKDFPSSIRIAMKLEGDSLKDMSNYLADGLKNFTKYFSKNKVDVVVILGDRSEALAVAIAAMYLNIPVVHINGGDVSGATIDESIRHAITKISHIHLVHTTENAERVIRMGEEKKRVFVVGALTLDTILSKKLLPKDEVFKKYNLKQDRITFLVVQHPITNIKDKAYSEMRELLHALDHLKKQTVLLYPNCDAGGKKIIDLIKKYERKEYLHTFKNLPHEDYLSIMKSSDVVIGNSSSAIIEAPSFRKPVINIGNRQKGRSRSENIVDIEPEKKQIIKTIEYVLTDKYFKKKVESCKNIFGDGKSSQRIVKILKNLKINDELIQKQIIY